MSKSVSYTSNEALQTDRFIFLDIDGSDSIEGNDLFELPMDDFGADTSVYDAEREEFADFNGYGTGENTDSANFCEPVRENQNHRLYTS